MKNYYFNTNPKNFGINNVLNGKFFGHLTLCEEDAVFITPSQFTKKHISPEHLFGLKEKYKIENIVMFDRVRENIISAPNRSLEANVNLSIGETIGRSINTSLTLLLTLMALMLFGGPTLKSFLLVLIIGVLVGTYSSIAVATQIVVAWEKQDFPKIFAKITRRRLPASE